MAAEVSTASSAPSFHLFVAGNPNAVQRGEQVFLFQRKYEGRAVLLQSGEKENGEEPRLDKKEDIESAGDEGYRGSSAGDEASTINKKRKRSNLVLVHLVHDNSHERVPYTLLRCCVQRSNIAEINKCPACLEYLKEEKGAESRPKMGRDATGKGLQVYICETTAEYRHLAHVLPQQREKVLEVGCSFGIASKAIVQSNISVQLSCIDCSHECIATCLKNFSNDKTTKFYCFDVLADKPSLVRLLDGVTLIFLDIGGNRGEHAIIAVLELLQIYASSCELVVVKSKALASHARSRLTNSSSSGTINLKETESSANTKKKMRWKKAGVHCLDGGPEWWKSTIVAKYYDEAYALRQFPPQSYLQERSLENQDSVFICRYHNYSKTGCREYKEFQESGGTLRCPHDHNHCHACGQEGHVGLKCPTWTVPHHT